MPKTLLDYLPREALKKAFLSKQEGYIYFIDKVDIERGLIRIFYETEKAIDVKWVEVRKFGKDLEVTQRRYRGDIRKLKKAAYMEWCVNQRHSILS